MIVDNGSGDNEASASTASVPATKKKSLWATRALSTCAKANLVKIWTGVLDQDDLQNVKRTSFSKDTSLIKFS